MNYDTLTAKELERRFSLYVFDWDKNSTLRLKQWQHIIELETCIVDNSPAFCFGSKKLFQSIVCDIKLRVSTRISATTDLDWNPWVKLFTSSTILYSQDAQTDIHIMKCGQFQLTYYFPPLSVTIWHAYPNYDSCISCPSPQFPDSPHWLTSETKLWNVGVNLHSHFFQ